MGNLFQKNPILLPTSKYISPTLRSISANTQLLRVKALVSDSLVIFTDKKKRMGREQEFGKVLHE